ncbi:hypothetical protein [Streptomyces profundus]|uniref:hypothetical protein n=1 Tax=Streptomyces profundus TaxID=2867410 RepID=UPI001D15FC34|nr:hypothetical protein [Streptomyces sp. MA3_2.13]UED84709.1 hypothetical protein K4G22_11230 [Streptomyces sp. MA3_2.13]
MPAGMTAEGTADYLRREFDARGAGEHPVDNELVRPFHALSGLLRATGTLFAGSALREISGERSTATLVVATHRFSYGESARVAAEGAMHSLVAAKGKGWTGGVYDLPCGPAAVVTGGHAYDVPWQDSSREPFVLRVAELQAYVPVPTSPSLTDQYLLTVSFSTPQPAHWETYMPSVVRLLRSIAFVAGPVEDGRAHPTQRPGPPPAN